MLEVNDIEAILQHRLPSYALLDVDRRGRFITYLLAFLRHTKFVGRARMRIDDDVRVTVGGTAVRLVLELGVERLQQVKEVVVYPHSVPLADGLAAGQVLRNRDGLSVHLGWAQVLKGLEDPRDGYDVVIHEFAHVLDHEHGRFDGVPRLRASQDYELWAHVLHRNFLEYWFGESAGSDVLRPYARSSPPEFFAVATEAFFERPLELERALPDLFLKLKRFYGFDPGAA